jgi:hypothetical protein
MSAYFIVIYNIYNLEAFFITQIYIPVPQNGIHYAFVYPATSTTSPLTISCHFLYTSNCLEGLEASQVGHATPE